MLFIHQCQSWSIYWVFFSLILYTFLFQSYAEWKQVLGNSVIINCMSFIGCKDGGMQCARAIRVSLGRLFISGKSDSEYGAFGADHIGVEHGHCHPLCFSSLFCHKVMQWIPSKSYFFQDHTTHCSHNERWKKWISMFVRINSDTKNLLAQV